MGRKGRRQAVRHGYVVIDKPLGWTSHDVVARVRGIVAERRVGHAGTLDPAATGVLPVAVGLATRTVEYLAVADKAYRATIRFGVTTDSADSEGDVIAETDASGLDLAAIRLAMERFRGEIEQVPPMHSAIKVNGQRLYDLARAGVTVEIAPRTVVIRSLEVVEWSSPHLTVDIVCSKGSYIRSLARDLGEAVSTGAHLAALRRTRTGPFTLEQSLTLDDLVARLDNGTWDEIALPPDTVLSAMPRLDLDGKASIDWGQGKTVKGSGKVWAGSMVRAYDVDGFWRGVGLADDAGDTVQPVKVVPGETE
ncbi:MAG TPA: tRNA pseudouridine(55) synthase TruB [Thermomicrobiales bacterium]|nr:tRNA pseudouridine(55) synthase TruB [Thermomicrobiales bacterium]